MTLTRRGALAALAAAPLALRVAPAQARATEILVHKDPSCGCCGAWVEHVAAAGFAPRVEEASDLGPIKARLRVPEALRSCHTALVEGYAIEGHAPAQEIRRLLAERPRAHGLAVPGMPIGSPGMEVPGAAEDVYDVILFGEGAPVRFARYRGATRIG